MSQLSWIGFCFVSLVVGFSIASQSWDGVSYWKGQSATKDRSLSSLNHRSTLSFTKSSLSELYSEKNVVFGGQVLSAQDSLGISLGHFIESVGKNKKDFACNKYNKVKLVFYGKGVAINGKSPEMRVIANCSTSKNLGHLNPIWVPFKKIYQSRAKNMSIAGLNYQIIFSNMGFGVDWPNEWGLDKVLFYNEQDHRLSRKIDLNDFEFKQRQPFSFDARRFKNSL